MLDKITFYCLSISSFLFNILFLIICDKFGNIFLEYLQILVYTNFFICCFGSLQFYIHTKKNLIYLKLEDKFLIFLIILFFIGFVYYLYKDLILSIVFLTTSISSLVVHLEICSQTFLNKLHKNSAYIFFISLIKFLIIFFSFFNNLDFIYSIIFINILIIILSINFLKRINLSMTKKKLFNILSGVNNIFGTATTTLDKVYVIHILPTLSVTYYLVFKIASIYQFLTELVYRKERFEITSGKYIKNKKVLFFKFIYLFTAIIIFNMTVKIFFNFFQSYMNLFLIYDLLEIIRKNIDAISFFFLGFLINALSGLSYDQIYKKYLYKELFNINIIMSFIFVVLLVFFGLNIFYISLIFFFSQIIELLLINFKGKSLNAK